MYPKYIIESFEILERNIESIDKKIAYASKRSKKAPQEFLEPELRRALNIRFISGPERLDGLIEYLTEEMERDYMCYFETETYKKNLKSTSWWNFTYAGLNSQIESFLIEEGLNEALEKLGLSNPLKPVHKFCRHLSIQCGH